MPPLGKQFAARLFRVKVEKDFFWGGDRIPILGKVTVISTSQPKKF